MLAPVGHWGGGDVWRVTSGEFPSNAYICGTGGGNCILIDGGLDPHTIDLAVQELALTPTAVFCTHGHFDHAGSAAHFQKKFGCPVYLHGADRKLLKSSNFMLMAFKVASRIEQPNEVTAIVSGQSVDVAGHALTFHGAPGHTPGSCVIEFGSALFTGDTIYCKGVGLSHLPGEQPDILKQSILALWPMLTAYRVVYPGHGGCATGADVRATNRALLEFLGLPITETKAVEL
ncbi:MAG TPA: MBL fold metallo-hydrolase [Duganella sp.]|nr:MBL fold metallo-hydrolase [Duganella sp.]